MAVLIKAVRQISIPIERFLIVLLLAVSFFSFLPQFPKNNIPKAFKSFWGGFYSNLGAFWKGETCIGHDNGGANITISSNSTLGNAVECNVGIFTVNAGITATIPAGGSFTVYANSVDIQGTLTAVGKGYAVATGPGAGTVWAGGAHGGNGGTGGGASVAGIGYGSVTNPKTKGSGGGGSSGTKAGGGLIRIKAATSVSVTGTITVAGDGGGLPAGGAGGGLWIYSDSLIGNGTITASGGTSTDSAKGAGGGGHIALYYNSKTFSGTLIARGGISAGGTTRQGGAGTIFEKIIGDPTGTVVIDNTGVTGVTRTPISGGSSIVGTITVSGGAVGEIASANFPAADMTVNAGTLYASGANILKSLTLSSTAVLTHDANTTAKTYYVDLTAENITIGSAASVIGDYLGYTAGNGSGVGSSANGGGSHGGKGGVAGGTLNDSIITPTDMGSGAYATYQGGSFIKLVATNTITVDGIISANGNGTTGSCGANNGAGAGGGIYISTDTFAGAGTGVIRANGGSAFSSCGAGGGGRIAIYYNTKTYSGITQAAGGTNGTVANRASAGTVFQKLNGGAGTLYIDNNAVDGINTPLTTLSETAITNIVVLNTGEAELLSVNRNDVDVTVQNAGYLVINGAATVDDVTVESGGTIRHDSNTSAKTNYINLTLDNLDVQAGGFVNTDAKGYTAGNGPSAGTVGYGGGGHGGNGGTAGGGVAGDSILLPDDMGSGGFAGAFIGGGLIKITASGTVTVSGTVSANGTGNTGGCAANNGGGAGGGIYISTDTLAGAGTGVISANGGSNWSSCGSGAGGRVAIYYTTKTYSGTITAYNGTQSTAAASRGGSGTVFEKASGSATGTLTIADNSSAPASYTPITGTSALIGTITITNTPMVQFDGFTGANAALTIPNGATTYFKGVNTFSSVTVNGTATHAANTTAKVNYLDIVATNFTISGTGTISANTKGYSQLNGPGAGTAAIGGSYGGVGGGGGAAAYGSNTHPDDLGSGSGNTGGGTEGGGLIKLRVSGTLAIGGAITATAANETNGPTGSGGGIYISAATLSGTANVQAHGGARAITQGTGGGGRVAIYYTSSTWSGAPTAAAGVGAVAGTAGTVYNPGAASYPGPY